MKKLLKTIILTPMWPLIGYALYREKTAKCGCFDSRDSGGQYSKCHKRAKAMLEWHQK